MNIYKSCDILSSNTLLSTGLNVLEFLVLWLVANIIKNSDIDIYYEGKSLGLKSLVEFPMQLEKFFGEPVDVIRKHNNLRPAFVKRIMKDIVYVW